MIGKLHLIVLSLTAKALHQRCYRLAPVLYKTVTVNNFLTWECGLSNYSHSPSIHAIRRYGDHTKTFISYLGIDPLEVIVQLQTLPQFPKLERFITPQCLDDVLFSSLQELTELRSLVIRFPESREEWATVSAAAKIALANINPSHPLLKKPTPPPDHPHSQLSPSRQSSASLFHPEFYLPTTPLQRLTHLEIIDPIITAFSQISIVANIPSLTHLYIRPAQDALAWTHIQGPQTSGVVPGSSLPHLESRNDTNIIDLVLDRCQSLQVLLLEVDHLALAPPHEDQTTVSEPGVITSPNPESQRNGEYASQLWHHPNFDWLDPRVVGMRRSWKALYKSWDRIGRPNVQYDGQWHWSSAERIVWDRTRLQSFGVLKRTANISTTPILTVHG